MKYINTEIKDVYIIEPKVIKDGRGYFMEAWKQEEFNKYVGKVDFIQENESKSSYGVLRGLHYQKGTTSQAKLVRVIISVLPVGSATRKTAIRIAAIATALRIHENLIFTTSSSSSSSTAVF